MMSLETLIFFAVGLGLGAIMALLLSRHNLRFFSRQIKTLSSEALMDNTSRFMDLAGQYFSTYAREARKETANLVKALRVPHVRGRWGEMSLRRVAELAGMIEWCDFEEQPVFGGDQGTVRPDMVVRLPGGRSLVVDAKTPLSAYLDALDARDEKERQERMKDHARQVMMHIINLSSKDYGARIGLSPEFVVLFIPGENFFSAALSVRPDLIEKGMEKNVILATPTTLIALLKTVAYSWKQEKSHAHAEDIRQLGVELMARMGSLTDHVNRLGKDIEKSAADYNRFVGVMASRVMPTARKLADLKVSSHGVTEPQSIEPEKAAARTFSERNREND